MAIQTLYDNGEDYQIESKYDGAVYAVATPDCICASVGDEFTLHYSSSNLSAYFEAGSQAVIGGGFFKITSRTTIDITANATYYIVARIDLTKPNGQRGLFESITNLSNAQSDNLNGNGSKRDLVLYKITSGASGISSVEDLRVIRGSGSTSVGGINLRMNTDPVAPLLKVSKDLTSVEGKVEINFKVISESSYNALSSKDSKTLYFVPES